MTDQNTNQPQTEPQQVTTDIVANGIVKGYFKLVAILLGIGLGIAILVAIVAAISSAADDAHRANLDASHEAESKARDADWKAHPHKYIEAQMDIGSGVSFYLDTACDKYSTNLCVDAKTAKDAKRLEHVYTNMLNAKKNNLSADLQQKAAQLVPAAEKAYDDDVLATAAKEEQEKAAADAKAKKQLQTDIEKGQ